MAGSRPLLVAEVPSVDAREGYVFPLQRREVTQVLPEDLIAPLPQLRHDPLEEPEWYRYAHSAEMPQSGKRLQSRSFSLPYNPPGIMR